MAASGIVSGETGAAGLSGLLELLRRGSPGQQQEQREEACRALGVNRESRVLLFNSEGVTDAEAYRRLVGEAHASSCHVSKNLDVSLYVLSEDTRDIGAGC